MYYKVTKSDLVSAELKAHAPHGADHLTGSETTGTPDTGPLKVSAGQGAWLPQHFLASHPTS